MKKSILIIIFFITISVLFFGCKAEVEHVHRYNFGWSYDSQYHWEASICDCGSEMVKEKTAHSFRSGTCTVCGLQALAQVAASILLGTQYIVLLPSTTMGQKSNGLR